MLPALILTDSLLSWKLTRSQNLCHHPGNPFGFSFALELFPGFWTFLFQVFSLVYMCMSSCSSLRKENVGIFLFWGPPRCPSLLLFNPFLLFCLCGLCGFTQFVPFFFFPLCHFCRQWSWERWRILSTQCAAKLSEWFFALIVIITYILFIYRKGRGGAGGEGQRET